MSEELFKIVEIEINSQCNLACSYCPNREFERKEKGEMSLENYDLILDQLEEMGFVGRLSHEFYGEPTLHPDFEEILRRTKKKLPDTKIELYTNGTKLTREKLITLYECGVDEFIITKHIGIKKLLVEDFKEDLSPTIQKAIRFQEHSALKKTNRGGALPDIGGGAEHLLPCMIPDFLVTITVEGNILPCFEDFFQNHEMGNLFQTPLKEIWNSEEYKKLRRDLKKGLRHHYKTCAGCNRIQTKVPGEDYFKA
jgi:radical SAM protein with 4Fe4S-binding SPASM domain